METPSSAQPVLSFRLGREIYGVRLGAVREIFEPEHVQPVPRAPRLIGGLADVRGRMVTVIDLPGLLDAEAAADRGGRMMILAEPQDHLALWSPGEIDLLNLELDALERLPGHEAELEVVEGYARTERAIVHILSTEKIFLLCEREVLKRYRTAMAGAEVAV